jgi:hypothetical protein
MRVNKSRRVRWVVYVTCMGQIRNAYKILVSKPERKRPLRRPKHRWKLILECITGKYGGNLWTGFMWLRIGTSGGLL